MQAFQLHFGHVIAFVAPILIAMFRTEITNVISAIIIVHNRRFLDKETIQIMDPAGEWRDVSIVCYRHDIPFSKNHGGVTVCHKDSGVGEFHETLSFSTWKTMRVRVPTGQNVVETEGNLQTILHDADRSAVKTPS